jgi:hypothetical protein
VLLIVVGLLVWLALCVLAFGLAAAAHAGDDSARRPAAADQPAGARRRSRLGRGRTRSRAGDARADTRAGRRRRCGALVRLPARRARSRSVREDA